MRVSVNGENRELHVYDRSTGVDYAKQILCSQEQLVTDMYGEFVLTEEEYNHWTELLAIQQESEDLLFELKDVLVKQELDDYMYEETKYMTTTIETIHMENICIKELKEALERTIADKEIGIILLTEKFGREFPEIIDDVKLHHKTPLIIEIPDRHGTGRRPDFITSYVNEAIGLKL